MPSTSTRQGVEAARRGAGVLRQLLALDRGVLPAHQVGGDPFSTKFAGARVHRIVDLQVDSFDFERSDVGIDLQRVRDGIRARQAVEERAVEVVVRQFRIEATVEATLHKDVGVDRVDGILDFDAVVVDRCLQAVQRSVGGLEYQAEGVGVGGFLREVRVAAGKSLELGGLTSDRGKERTRREVPGCGDQSRTELMSATNRSCDQLVPSGSTPVRTMTRSCVGTTVTYCPLLPAVV